MSELIQLQPYDSNNQTLESNVRPTDWVNPIPSGRYNLVVIGAGTAGLVTAAAAAGLGAKVALIERQLMGGDCLNVGCVPSKGLIRSARIAAAVRDAEQYGVDVPAGSRVDFPKVMKRMRSLRASISPHDSAKRFRGLGVDVYLGEGKFLDHDSISVNDQRLEFKKAVVATGARASELTIPGYQEAECLTNESLFSLTELPQRLAVIGAGPIGVEMAQCFARFGSRVTVVDVGSRILPREQADAALIVQQSMKRDAVEFELNAEVVRLERRGDERAVVIRQDGVENEVVADQVLVSIGRTPNVNGLELEAVGVEYNRRKGIKVNDRLQTSNPKIYAAGDVATGYKFTHSADFMARIVIQNALFMGRARFSSLLIPWTTYTSPELGHVGLNPDEAAARGFEVDSFMQPLASVDRAILEGETEGFVRVYVRKGTDRIVGATVVAANAGDLISELTLAIKNGLGLKAIGSTIHPYPTHAEAIRKLGDLYSRTRFTPTIQKLAERWLAWTR